MGSASEAMLNASNGRKIQCGFFYGIHNTMIDTLFFVVTERADPGVDILIES